VIAMIRIKALVLSVVLLATLPGCGTHSMWPETADLRLVGREMVAALMNSSRVPMDHRSTIVTTTFVSIDDLKLSSTLGRALSGHVTTALNEDGYRVVVLNLTQSLQMREHAGELALSRNVKELLDTKLAADALIVGTYYLAKNHVYITGRLIQPTTGEILASHEVRLPLNSDIAKLAQTNRPGSMLQ